LKPSKEQLEKVYGEIMKDMNDLRLQIDSKKKKLAKHTPSQPLYIHVPLPQNVLLVYSPYFLLLKYSPIFAVNLP
jgi:hypothetical protein